MTEDTTQPTKRKPKASIKDASAPRKPRAKKTTVAPTPEPVAQPVAPVIHNTIDADAVSLEEFTEALEQTVSSISKPSRTKLSNAFSHYDLLHNMLCNIPVKPLELPGHTVMYAYLSTEESKCAFSRILVETWPSLVVTSHNTNHSAIVVHTLQMPESFLKLKSCPLLYKLVSVFINWQNTAYFNVGDMNAYSSKMTEEIESHGSKPLKHTCVLLKTKKYLSPDNTPVASGLPIIWNFTGCFPDPVTKVSNFLYEIAPEYYSGSDVKGLRDQDGNVFHRYNLDINDIATIFSENKSDMLFLFHTTDIESFVIKETTALFNEIELKLV